MPRRILQLSIAVLCAAAAGLTAAACGSTPATPTPVPAAPQQQAPQPINAPPVINSVAATVTRTEVNTDVTFTADVSDAETPVDKLVFTWTATAGAITGSGPSVTYRLPKDAVLTPVNVTVSLQVTENYVDNGVAKQNTATGSAAPLLVHDSKQEIGDMGVKFLVDLFGNSNVSPSACLVDFSDSCVGKSKEFGDISNNRDNFRITSASANVEQVTFNAPAASATTAEADLHCEFHDHNFPTNKDGVSTGTCILTAVYQNDRWWLCESSFDGSCGSCVVIGGRRMTMEEFFMAGIKDR